MRKEETMKNSNNNASSNATSSTSASSTAGSKTATTAAATSTPSSSPRNALLTTTTTPMMTPTATPRGSPLEAAAVAGAAKGGQGASTGGGSVYSPRLNAEGTMSASAAAAWTAAASGSASARASASASASTAPAPSALASGDAATSTPLPSPTKASTASAAAGATTSSSANATAAASVSSALPSTTPVVSSAANKTISPRPFTRSVSGRALAAHTAALASKKSGASAGVGVGAGGGGGAGGGPSTGGSVGMPLSPTSAGAGGGTTSTSTSTTAKATATSATISPAPFRRSVSGRALAAHAASTAAKGPGGGSVSLPPTPMASNTTRGDGGPQGSAVAAVGLSLSPHVRRLQGSGLVGFGGGGGNDAASSSSTPLGAGMGMGMGGMMMPGPPPLSGPGAVASSSSAAVSATQQGNASLPSSGGTVGSAGTSIGAGSMAQQQQQQQQKQQKQQQKPTQQPQKHIELDPDPPLLTSLRSMPLSQLLPSPRRPAKCPLFCAFYAEFDIVVGPKICYDSPHGFMDGLPVEVGIDDIHDALRAEFDEVRPPSPSSSSSAPASASVPASAREGRAKGAEDDDYGDANEQVETRNDDDGHGDNDGKEHGDDGKMKSDNGNDRTKDGDANPNTAAAVATEECGGETTENDAGGRTDPPASRTGEPLTSSELHRLTMPDIETIQPEEEGERQAAEAAAAAAAGGGVGPGSGGTGAAAEAMEKGAATSSTSSQDGTSVTSSGRPPIPLRRSSSASRFQALSNVSSSSSLQQQQKQQQQQQDGVGGNSQHQSSAAAAAESSNSSSDSIFDSTSEYIITGNELADQMICLSTHNMHILTRPTIIKDKRYERNSLLYSVGFVLRRVEDPRPFRPILSKLASTLHDMEVESRFLSDPRTRPQIRRILQGILVSLNSRSSECNMLLDNANVLNLKLFRPPKAPAPPVPDHVVPVLLRPEWQLQTYDWDLTINWIVPHIDGFKYTRLISQSSEVDMEMVRACLRVLRHHGVLALVDVFRYSNIYECTPLAASMLAGDAPKLLSAAYHFVSKSPATAISGGGSRPSTPGPFDHHSENPNAPPGSGGGIGGASSRGGERDASDANILMSTTPVSSTVPIPPHILASSFPPRSGNLLRLKGDGSGASGIAASPTAATYAASSASKFSASVGTAPTSHLDTTLNVASTKKKERIMKAALAQLYCSCRRDVPLGDMLIEKVLSSTSSPSSSKARARPNSPARAGDRHNQQPPNQGREREDSGSGDDFRQQSIKSQSPAASRGGMSDSGESGNLSNASAQSTPHPRTEKVSHNKGRQSKPTSIDWTEAFEHFDHRRFVTFGVIHGLIRRVHAYPMSIDLNVDEEGLTNPVFNLGNDEGDERSGRTDSVKDEDSLGDVFFFHNSTSEIQPQQLPPSVQYVSPNLQPVPPPGARTPSPLTPHKSIMAPLSLGTTAMATSTELDSSGHGRPSPRKEKKQLKILAKKVALSMDGTRCDDELCCMYQKSMEELVELVETIGKGVIVVRSTSDTQSI